MRVTKKKIWGVRDPGPDSVMSDVMFPTSIEELPELVLGTGLLRWRFENHEFYDLREEAVADAERRLARRDDAGDTESLDGGY